MRREAQAAAEQLGKLLEEREADRRQLAETQQALQEAMQHLEDISDEAEVLQCCSIARKHHAVAACTIAAKRSIRGTSGNWVVHVVAERKILGQIQGMCGMSAAS